jgi:hypothetical protein
MSSIEYRAAVEHLASLHRERQSAIEAVEATTPVDWHRRAQLRDEYDAAIFVARGDVIRSMGRTTGDGQFADCLAPSGAGEAIEARTIEYDAAPIGGGTIEYGARTFQPRLASRRTIVSRVRRAAVARRVEASSIEAVETPLDWLRQDVEAGRLPRSTARVVETSRYLRDVHGRIPKDGRIRYVTARVEASGAMVQVERLARDYANERRGVVALMAHDASGDGRGTIQAASRIPGAVNGTEVRGAARWQASRRAAITTTTTDADGVERTHPVDWRCYRVAADGTRTPLVSTATARKRKRSAASAKATTDARLRTIAGTLGVEAQG